MVSWLVLLGFTLKWGIRLTNQPPTNPSKTITYFQKHSKPSKHSVMSKPIKLLSLHSGISVSKTTLDESKRPTMQSFKDYEEYNNYVMGIITYEERRVIRRSWSEQYDNGEKDWYKYLLSSAYNISINKS